ncbi:hypothetical protein [Phenylobacterium sp.]|uniref:hypothetical protein n=1 Tax=Phenylobacterium sp. TaxID=1871053 RepID=UPI0035B0408E
MRFLYRTIAAGFTLLVISAGGPLSVHASTLEQRILAASEKLEQGDCRGSLKYWDAVLRDKAFPNLTESARDATYNLAVYCALRTNQDDRAYRYALGGTRQSIGTEFLWRVRFSTELDQLRDVQAVETAEAMAMHNPAALNEMPVRRLFQLEYRVSSDPQMHARLLRVVAAPSYRPYDVFGASDGFRRKYAVMLADAGDIAGALELVRSIEDPPNLLKASTDSRLRAALPPEFDGRAQVERSLAKFSDFAANHPESLAVVVRVAQHQRMLGLMEEALATLEAARPDQPGKTAFVDQDEYIKWWWDEMARSYQWLGRYDDAVAALRAGMLIDEYGRSNVSQTLNLSLAQYRFGRPDDALATISDIEKRLNEVSAYGRMVMHLVRGCSRMATGQAAAAQADLSYAVAHELDHQEALTTLQLCAGDLDGAAATLIRRLDDPGRRAEALLELSDFDPPPATYPTTAADLRFAQVSVRKDVQAAIARAGLVHRFRLQKTGF